MLRDGGRWDDLAEALERFATEATQKDEKIAGWLRLARVREEAQVAGPRGRRLRARPRPRARATPSRDLPVGLLHRARDVGPPRRALRGPALGRRSARQGGRVRAILQIAMVHWRMRGRPEAAEPYFERLRKLDPAHPGMLTFFREWCSSRAERALASPTILTDAQRAMPDGPERAAIAAEIAKLAEEGANAQKAIEQWRTVLRQDPAQQGGARRAEAPLPADGELERALGSPPPGARQARGRRRGRAPPGAARDRGVYRDAGQERLGARHGAHADRAARPDRSRERPRARARLRGAAALARSLDDAGAPRRARGRGRREGGALPRDRAPLARSVLERAERGRGVREAPRGRSGAIARRSIG